MKKNTNIDWLDKYANYLPRLICSTNLNVLKSHSGDKWFAEKNPQLVITPRTTTDVQKALLFASKFNVPVTARGAGFGYVGGCVPARGGIVLAMSRMNRIIEVSTQDGIAIVEPGVITGDLQKAAQKVNWFYPPDPASLKDCSIGGNIATNAGGPRCLKYGVTKHYVLGLQVVLADGSVIQTGGRCHKNKTGFGLTELFVGSEGMLGVVTQATLRLIPHPPERATITAGFQRLDLALAAVDSILNSGVLPAALEIADAFTINAAKSFLPKAAITNADGFILVEVDGDRASVRSQTNTIKNILLKHRGFNLNVGFGDKACEDQWMMRRQFSEGLKAMGLTKLNEDVVVPRSKLADLFKLSKKLSLKYGFPIASFGHAGDGNIHLNLMIDRSKPGQEKRSVRALDDLFKEVLHLGGALTGEHGIGLAKMKWWPKAASRNLIQTHTKIKHALDPLNILNPGKFLG